MKVANFFKMFTRHTRLRVVLGNREEKWVTLMKPLSITPK